MWYQQGVGLRGVGTTNSNGCASDNVAIGEAMRYVRDGWADVMVAGAAEAPLSPLTFGAFAFIRTMSQQVALQMSRCKLVPVMVPYPVAQVETGTGLVATLRRQVQADVCAN